MTTTAELISWLKKPSHIRTVLVEVEAVITASTTTTFYLSSRPYVSDTNQQYENCIVNGVSFTESLNLDGGTASVSYGDIEIDNTAGVRDSWINYGWANKVVNIYIGDPRWSRSSYYKIFTGLIADIVSKNSNSLNLILVDKAQSLNNPISETYFENNVVNGDSQLKPVTFGECFNVTPVLTNRVPNILEYCVHAGPIEGIIEVRDNGLPIGFTYTGVDPGCFALTQSPYGQITCSVQGHKNPTYYNTVPSLIIEILTNYVPSGIRLNPALDIDLVNFSQIETLYPAPVGFFSESTVNAWDLCNQLASSIGCQLYFDTLGKLKLARLDLNGNGNTPHVIQPKDIELNSISIQDKRAIKGTTKIAYCKNWTVQKSGLAGGVPPESANLFENEWLYSTDSNSSVISDYNLVDDAEQRNTLLITTAGADIEAARYINLASSKSFIYNIIGYAHLLTINLGDNVLLSNDRYELNSTPGVVVNISRDWISGRVRIGVLV